MVEHRLIKILINLSYKRPWDKPKLRPFLANNKSLCLYLWAGGLKEKAYYIWPDVES